MSDHAPNVTATPPPTRAFTIVQVAATAQQPVKTDLIASPALHDLTRSVCNPAMLVLCALCYLAGVLWYVVTSSVPTYTTTSNVASESPYLWVVCVPYAALMIHKLLTTIRAMDATVQPDEYPTQRELEQGGEEDADLCDEQFGDHASHDAIAVVGDVCIYVIGILLLCYAILPWQLYVE